jgi:GAF domain-containing protein
MPIDRDALQELVRVARAAGPALVPQAHDEMLAELVVTARGVFEAATCSVAIVDHDAGELEYRVADGATATEIVGFRLPLTRGIAGFVASSGQGIGVDEVESDPRFAADVAERMGYIPRSMIVVPIFRGDETQGILTFLDPGGSLGALEALDLAGRFAAIAAGALALGAAFGDLGRSLLDTLASLSDDTDLVDELLRADDNQLADTDAQLAGVLSTLAELDDDERATATRLLAAFADYARRRTRR